MSIKKRKYELRQRLLNKVSRDLLLTRIDVLRFEIEALQKLGQETSAMFQELQTLQDRLNNTIRRRNRKKKERNSRVAVPISKPVKKKFTQSINSKKERRISSRLLKLPTDRICPKCGKLYLKSRSWVCLDNVSGDNSGSSTVVCRSCYWKEKSRQQQQQKG